MWSRAVKHCWKKLHNYVSLKFIITNLKLSSFDAGDPDSILVGKFPWRRDSRLQNSWASLVAQMVGNPSAMQQTWVRLLGWEGPLEEGVATHCSILALRIPWTEDRGA